MRGKHRRKIQLGIAASTWFALLVMPIESHGQLALPATSANANKVKTDHSERALAAIDLAVIAAEGGIMDVSLEAMKRAVGKGPPVTSVNLGGLLGPKQPQRSSRSVSNAAAEAAAAQARLARRLVRLQKAWVEGDADPKLAYAAWKELVLPKSRPSEAFAYSVGGKLNESYSYGSIEFEYDKPKTDDCGAAALVEWARKAEQLDDLRQAIADREKLPASKATVLLLRIIIAGDPSAPLDAATSLCEQLASSPSLLISDPNAELLFAHTWRIAERLGKDSSVRKQLIDAVMKAIPSQEKWLANEWLRFLAAKQLRETVDRGDEAAFRAAAHVNISRYDSIRANNVDYVASREASMYSTAATRAFDAGHPELGVECLRAFSLYSVSDDYRSSGGLLSPTGGMLKHVLRLAPEERFELLRDIVWRMPNLGLSDAIMLTPIETIPKVFVPNAKKKVDVAQIMAPNGIAVSLFEWLARDAIALGKENEITDKIESLRVQGSDDARLADFVFSIAKNETDGFTKFVKQNDSDPKELDFAVRPNQSSPLDLIIVQQALNTPGYAETAKKHYKKVLKTTRETHKNYHLGWLRRIKYEAEVDEGIEHVTHESLKHWTVSDDVRRTDILTGHVPKTLWKKRGDNNAWGHEFGTQKSYLLLKYPIVGDFTMSFRCKDGFYEEGGATCAGLAAEFYRYDTSIRMWGVGERNRINDEVAGLVQGGMTDIRFAKQASSLTIHIADKDTKELELLSEAFPFIGFHSSHTQASTFDSVKIEGDISIPRKVQMLSPSLLGWSTKFSRKNLPAIKFFTEQAESSNSKSDWQFADGNLESIDQAKDEDPEQEEKNRKKLPHESVVQYLRPLCDGEKISLEFFHQPGSYSMAPAIGRTVMLLSSGQEVALHWLTSDDEGGWSGIDQDNQAMDENAKQLTLVSLKENDWNQLSVRLEGDVITLELNGEDIYQRRWDPITDWKFGIFHDPSKYQVRVRNAELSGDWPESLPADLFELR